MFGAGRVGRLEGHLPVAQLLSGCYLFLILSMDLSNWNSNILAVTLSAVGALVGWSVRSQSKISLWR